MSESSQLPLRRGVVAVIAREERLLTIRRSATVVAPLAYCFPGGGIETTESEEDALQRELHEELGVVIRPLRRLWRSVTPWRVDLSWWQAEFASIAEPRPNPAEVASVHWVTIEEMRALDGVLESNLAFLAAWERGEFVIEGLVPPGNSGG